jgi:predicted AlkP superfamily phosphohydrolase/phosphomutase
MRLKSRSHPLVIIALDAAEPALIENWMQAGVLPVLKRLQEEGAYTRLASSAELLAGSPWPTFYTGAPPQIHGLYHWQQWRPAKMKVQIVRPNWLPVEPFWRRLNRKVVALDIPMTYRPGPFRGVEISGWATHDHLDSPASHPKNYLQNIIAEFGPSPVGVEIYARQSFADLMALGDELVASVEKVTEVASKLMAKEAWDLFMVAYGATHRGGHKLWDETGLSDQADSRHAQQLQDKLKEIYVACDRAVGQLVAAAPNEANVFVFSLHGMGANTSRSEVLEKMIGYIMGSSSDSPPMKSKPDALQRLREAVPLAFRSSVKDRLPQNWQKWLTHFWVKRRIDWTSIPLVVPDADLQGYLRINMKRREKKGSIMPGDEYDRICNFLVDGLLSFVDGDTGQPLVKTVLSSKNKIDEGERHHLLPDLIVQWCEEPAANHRRIESSQFGSFGWPTPGRNPSGRSGNHRGEGFLIAKGPSIANRPIKNADILDLAPSISRLLGEKTIGNMTGKVLEVIQN